MNGKRLGIILTLCSAVTAILGFVSSIFAGKQQKMQIREAVNNEFKSRGL